MNSNFTARLFTIILAGLILAGTCFMPGLNSNAWAKSEEMGKPKIAYDGERPVHPGYPRRFDIVGHLDRLAADEAVIDDSWYRLSPAVSYHTPNQRHTFQSRLDAGDAVGCQIDSNGEITSMWQIAD